MNILFKSKGFRWGLLSLMLGLLMVFPNPAKAQEWVTGDVCVDDYQSGAVCTANDVRIEKMEFVDLVEGCNEGDLGWLTAEFRMMISAVGSPDRYDIGVFVDLSGTPDGALTGDDCYHGYMPPPITTTVTYGDINNDGFPDIVGGPWWNGEPGDINDTCGDLETNTQAFSYLVPLTLRCVDTNNDGTVDVSVCASWDNNAGTTCSGVYDAFPGTKSKCSCNTIELPFSPSRIDLLTLEARSSNSQKIFTFSLAALAGFGLLLTIGIILSKRRGQTEQ